MSTTIRAVLGALVLLVLGACSRRELPPGAEDLEVAVPPAWRQPAGSGTVNAWLGEIGSRALLGLVVEAWRANPDLSAAKATIDQAEAQVALAGARAGLQVGANAGLGRGRINTRLPADANSGTPARWVKLIDNSYELGLSASWELDLWGGTLAEARAAAADSGAAVDTVVWAHCSLAAQVARSWLGVVAADEQVALMQALVDNLAQALAVTGERFDAGIADAVAVHAARMELDAAAARLAEQRQLREVASQGLTALLGRYPDAALATGAAELPDLPPPPGAGLPGELLARRPDIRAAGLRVLAAKRRIWSAKTAFFPRITLTASGGYRSDAIRHLLDPERLVWNLLGGLAAPLLDGGRNQATLDLRRAQQVELLARYQATVLRAFGEVEAALAKGERLTERGRHLAAVTTQAAAAADRAREQFEAGLIGSLEHLAMRRRVIEARLAFAGLRLLAWHNRIDLHLALGGAPVTVRPATAAELEALREPVPATGADLDEETP